MSIGLNRSVQLLVVALLAITEAALADDLTYTCEKVRPYEPFKGTIPKPFILVPLCPDATPPVAYVSHYSFVGDATVSGTVHYQDTDTGPSATFAADQMSKALLPTLPPFDEKVFSLGDEDVRKFHMPALKGKGKNCWEAPATIRIKRIHDVVEESYAQGVYLPLYTVIRVGKYRGCKAEIGDVRD